MAKLTIDIESNDAVFEDGGAEEMARILDIVKTQLRSSVEVNQGFLLSLEGHKCGEYEYDVRPRCAAMTLDLTGETKAGGFYTSSEMHFDSRRDWKNDNNYTIEFLGTLADVLENEEQFESTKQWIEDAVERCAFSGHDSRLKLEVGDLTFQVGVYIGGY